MKTIILGAGITGLATAANLLNGGHDVIILEKRDVVGGLASTLTWKNHVMDYGAFICYPLLKALLPKEVSDAIAWREVQGISSQIFMEGNWRSWPIPLPSLFKSIGPLGILSASKDLLFARCKFRSPERIRNAEDYMVSRVGKKLLRYSGLLEEIFKFTGRPARDLSPRFVTDHLLRFDELSIRRVLTQRFFHSRPQGAPVFPVYPQGGIGRIPAVLESFLSTRGAKFYKSISLDSIENDGKRVSGVTFFYDGHRVRLDADAIISTIPIHQSLHLLGKTSPDDLPSRNLLLLFLIINKPSVTGRQLSYAFDESIPFKRLVEFKFYDPLNAPVNQSGIAAEICFPHDCASPDPKFLYSRVVNCLKQMNLVEPEEIIDSCFRVSPYAYPVETAGFEAIRDLLLADVTMDNMVSCGRQGIFRYSQLSFGWAMGTAAADLVNQHILNKERFLELCHDFSYHRSIG